MPDTRHIRQFLLQNRAAFEAGQAQLIDWVGVDKEGEVCLIKFKPAQNALLKGEKDA